MPEVTIEIYRGFKITFNTERERFSAKEDDGKWHEKQSYAAAKKWIDDFIKDNSTFEPFDAVRKPDTFRLSDDSRLKIIGIRKDGRFITEDDKKVKGQMSDYEEERWIVYHPDLEKHFGIVAILQAEKDTIDKKIKEEVGKIKSPSLRKIKEKYLPKT